MKKITIKVLLFAMVMGQIHNFIATPIMAIQNEEATKPYALDSIVGQSFYVAFPDSAMAIAVAIKLSKAPTDTITQSDIDNTTELDLGWCGIEDASGIEQFVNLKVLKLNNNYLISFNGNGLQNLETLWLHENKLEAFSGEGLNNVKELFLWINKIATFDAGDLGKVEVLHVQSNLLTSFDARGMNNIISLYVWENQLTSINLEGLNKLENLSLIDNKLTTVDTSGLTSLTNFTFENNAIIDFSLQQYNAFYYHLSGADQTYEAKLIKNFTNQDYTFTSLPIFEQIPTYGDGSAIEYSLIKPDMTEEVITPTAVLGKMTIDKALLDQEGNYALVAKVKGGNFANSEYTLSFSLRKRKSFSILYHKDQEIVKDISADEIDPSIDGTSILIADKGDLSKEGHTFANWNTQEDGLGTVYNIGDALLLKDNLALYAQWSINSYEVSFDLNGGTSDALATQTIDYGQQVDSVAKPTKEGYTFIGWGIDPLDVSNVWNFGSDLVPSHDTILYALWSINSYEVSFDLNGGTSDALATQTINYGQQVDSVAKPTKEGYTFIGWGIDPLDVSNVWNFGSNQVPSHNMILYALWLEDEVTEKPGIDIEVPGIDIEVPGIDIEVPGIDIEKPGIDIEKPGIDIEKPSNVVEKPETIKGQKSDVENGLPPRTGDETAKYGYLYSMVLALIIVVGLRVRKRIKD